MPPLAYTLEIPHPLLRQIELESRFGYPLEICGLLLGRTAADAARVFAIRQSPNISPDDRRKSYFMPLEWLLATQREVRASGWDVLGAYHSHPDAAPIPSNRDLDEAWPEFIYLIVSLDDQRHCRSQAWRRGLHSHDFEQVRLCLIP